MLVDPLTFKIAKKPAFIVIDGINGAGKSTLQAEMAKVMAAKNLSCLTTREPGATPLGKELRTVLLNQKEERLSELAELFIFAADRNEHVTKVVSPALKAGKSVISDRYYYSTVAFQGYGRGINRNTVEAINCIAIDGVVPDLLILLDLEPALGLARNRTSTEKNRPEMDDSFEYEELAFHQRLRTGFLELVKKVKEPCIVLDASQPPSELVQSVTSILERSFNV